jgi:hypothetical protein
MGFMLRKILVNTVTTLTVGVIFYAIFIAKKEMPLVKALLNVSGKTKIFQEPLGKNSYADPDLEGLAIPNVLSVKRIACSLQWKETMVGDTAAYTKVWSQTPINSDKFSDKTKINPRSVEKYKNLEVIYDVKLPKHITLERDFVIKKIRYKKPNLDKIHVKKSFDGKEKIVTKQNSKNFGMDLDVYADGGKKIEKDTFKLIDGNTLVNSVIPLNPQIGDVRIEYWVFSPNFVIALANINKEKMQVKDFIFTKNTYDFTQSKFVKAVIITAFIGYGVVIFFIWLFSVNNIKKYAKKFVLNFVPFINEYLIFSPSHYQASFLTILCISFVINIYTFFLVVGIFTCIVNRDYYCM